MCFHFFCQNNQIHSLIFVKKIKSVVIDMQPLIKFTYFVGTFVRRQKSNPHSYTFSDKTLSLLTNPPTQKT